MALFGAWGVYEQIEASHAEAQVQTVSAAFADFRSVQSAIADKQEVRNALIVQQHDAIAAQASSQFKTQIDNLRKANHAHKSVASHIVCEPVSTDSVRHDQASTGSGTMSTFGNSSGQPDATTSSDVANLPYECTVTTQQLVDLQAWVKQTR